MAQDASDPEADVGTAVVLVEMGDIVVGDADGVVLPRHPAAQLGHEGREPEAVEAWIKTQIEKRRAGVFALPT